MEAVMMNAKNRIGNPNRNFVTNRNRNPNLYSYPSDDLILASFLAGGHFAGGGLLSMPPPSLNRSYPPAAVSVLRAPPQNLQHHRQQPPLLPLPISMPLHHQNMNMNMNMNIYRSNSCSNNNNNNRLSPPRANKSVKNRGRDPSLTPKKSKNQKRNSKREEVDLVPPPVPETESSISEIIGPDPKDLPISRVFNKSGDIIDKFSGSIVFTPSPPPSSLPLPTFSLRPKLSCNAEAAGVDAGATDSLRRLLRL